MSFIGTITMIMVFLISVISFYLGYLQFNERGFLLNNSYIYASKEERESMDKKPHYRQSGVVLTLVAFIFLFEGFQILFRQRFFFYAVILTTLILIVYSIVSSIKISKGI